MSLQDKLSACLRQAVENHEAAGVSLLILKDGEELCHVREGFADTASGKPLRRDSIFRLYSQSKPVTAAAAMPYSTHVAFRWFSPTARRMRWCRWSVSASMTCVFPVSAPDICRSNALTTRLMIARAVSKIGTPIARIGTPRLTKSESDPPLASGIVASVNPMNIEPVSPRNTDAGLKL